jgi:hypothetical protein
MRLDGILKTPSPDQNQIEDLAPKEALMNVPIQIADADLMRIIKEILIQGLTFLLRRKINLAKKTLKGQNFLEIIILRQMVIEIRSQGKVIHRVETESRDQILPRDRKIIPIKKKLKDLFLKEKHRIQKMVH